MPTTWQAWLRGLIAAFISGGATSITTIAIDPDKFNVSTWTGFEHVLIGAAVAGFFGAALYLKQSPVPDVQTTTQTTTLETKTIVNPAPPTGDK